MDTSHGRRWLGTRRRYRWGAGALLSGLTFLVAAPPAAATQPLLDAWTQAGPEGIYDKVLHLDSLGVYTGGLMVTSGVNAIRGHGALIDLQSLRISVSGSGTRLDIDGCVFMNGGNTVVKQAVAYNPPNTVLGASGDVTNCVFYHNHWGLYSRGSTNTVTNCVFAGNVEWGLVLHEVYTPTVVSCVGHENESVPGTGGDFAHWCGCGGIPPVEIEAPPGSFIDDPMFIDPSTDPQTADFHLQPESPCRGAGTPPGTNIGAYQENATPIVEMSWGRLKSHYPD